MTGKLGQLAGTNGRVMTMSWSRRLSHPIDSLEEALLGTLVAEERCAGVPALQASQGRGDVSSNPSPVICVAEDCDG